MQHSYGSPFTSHILDERIPCNTGNTMQHSYGSPFTSHILDVIYWTILILIFDGVTDTVKPYNLATIV